MYYPQDVIEEVRTGNDIVEVIGRYTTLKQAGNSFVGLCPFHKEKSPSFSVSADKQLYHCFGCGASGNVISFIMQKENYDFVDTIKYLADRINYTLPEAEYTGEAKAKNELRSKLFEIHKLVARRYYDNLSTKYGEVALNYLDKRQLSTNIRRKYGLGYSLFKRDDVYKFLSESGYSDNEILESGLALKDKNGEFYDRFINRLMFPIIDVQGRIIGFGGRSLESDDKEKKSPKYLNSPDTLIFNKSHNLYSINFARLSKTREFILVEGYMDVISLYQAGFHNVVAALGTAFNENHAKALKKYADKVILLFDSDEAGVKAVLRAIPVLLDAGISPKVLQVTGAKDPDEYINKYGAESFANLVSKAKSYISFQIDIKRKQYDLSDVIQNVDFTKEVAKIIASLSSPIERDAYIKETAKMTSISETAIKSEVDRLNQGDEKIDTRKINMPKYKLNSVGIDDARRSIINIVTTRNFIYPKIKDVLKPEELVEPIYVDILQTIYSMYEKNEAVYPAQVVSCFDDIEAQQIISSIFMIQTDYEDINQLQSAVNDQLKLIKKTYIDMQVSKLTSPDDIIRLVKEKRNIESLNIILS